MKVSLCESQREMLVFESALITEDCTADKPYIMDENYPVGWAACVKLLMP